ncbi:alpha/beta hydrolase [Radiobacillus kanasensis]|uniref:alpha/beta fold hydrolase n=1 Tax=Radiobacillus kanasensis TaxID=2844358 RepID=UPI001E5C39FF|nr:alpha/beta hydrolase [Radiobacillus kanasensis]UFU01198.1 alpha/beta hydrolase [Radiobacillus kanasensis]
MKNWKRQIISTARGYFEIFVKGKGSPLCVTHLYSEFNESGDYFADSFTETNTVYLVNLRETGMSEKAKNSYELSMLETIFDLEAIREQLGEKKWAFAGHSTGGMLGIVYGIYFSEKLSFSVIVGAAAREYMTFSEDCIYNPAHVNFHRMQQLNVTLKNPNLVEEERQTLQRERVSYSLYEPERYEELFCKPIQKKMSSIRMDYFNREIQLFDVTKKLKFIINRTLIMCGAHDVQCPLTYSEEMARLIPFSNLVVFQRSNHYPFLEEEDEFKKQYISFLQKYSFQK